MITNINLKGFRKYIEKNLNIKNNLVILVGPNATGKTSILEAIYLISRCKSHRTNDFSNIINEDSQFSVINIKNDKDVYKMIISKNGKKVLINNAEFDKISEFVGNIKTVMFSPNDLNLIYGSKSDRRNFLDIELSMIDKKYLIEIKKYKKFLKERNEILKIYDESKKIILDVITKELCDSARIINNYRNKFINDLNIYIRKIHMDLYKEKLELKYISNVDIENIENVYLSKLQYDVLTKMTNNGIHRDEFLFYINDYEASEYASQGQVRSMVLTLKIALFYYLKKLNGDNVILLLDDVFSELDITRQSSLVKFLLSNNQTFITTTNIDLIPQALKDRAEIILFEKE